jgi:hypothetical protein
VNDIRRLHPHIALSVASALAYHQLSDLRKFYDIEHYSEVLNTVAQALCRVAAIYVADDAGVQRALSAGQLSGAKVRRGATLLVLADGHECRHLSVLRSDLRDAIAILARTGLTGFSAQREPK